MGTRERMFAVSFVVVAGMVLCCREAIGQARDSVSTMNVSGFVDTYYSWNTARPASGTNRLRNFDINAQQVVVSAAEIDAQRAANPIGFRVDIDAGPTSDLVFSGQSGSLNLLMQAYLTAVVPVGAGLTVDAGKFMTHMGYETMKAKDNFNYSRSFQFAWAIPYYHLGARASYPVTQSLTVGAQVYNGWNGTMAGSGKTFGSAIIYSPIPALSLTANWIGGPDGSDTAGTPFRSVAEAIVTFQATDLLALCADGIIGHEPLESGAVSWRGIALYARYAATENSAVSVRGEVYADPQGFTTGLAQDLREFTLTYEYRFLTNLLVRAEYRYDRSTVDAFDGRSTVASLNHQSTIALGGIVTF